MKDVSSIILQQALGDQKAAFEHFFNPKLNARYPRFKRKDGRQSTRLTKAAFRYREGEITLALEPPAALCALHSLALSQDRAGRYFISCLCDFTPEALPVTPKTVGIDLGLTDLFITSEGMKSGKPRHLKRYEAKLAYRQRRLAKKQKGSKNRAKARQQVARLHAKIADGRRDINAARNIRTAGLAGLVCGASGAGAAARPLPSEGVLKQEGSRGNPRTLAQSA